MTATSKATPRFQSDLFQKVEGILTEEETAIYHRGRNTNSHPPKNAKLRDYKAATGMEALIGYLYLKGESGRITELLRFLTEE